MQFRYHWFPYLAFFIAVAPGALCAQGEFPFPAPEGEVRVLSWNIEFLGSRSPRRSDEQVAAVARRIATFDAAVLALQEISSVTLLESVRDDLGPEWQIYRPGSLNAFLYDSDRVEALSLEVLERLTDPPFTAYTGRGTFLPISGVFRPLLPGASPFRVINVHFHPGSASTRADEGEWVSSRVIELLHGADEPEDIILLGDMNGEPSGAPHPELQANGDLVFFEKENGPSTFWSGVAIDHIYATAGFAGAVPKGTAFVVRPEHYGETVEQFEETYSDHFPVFVDVCPPCPRRPRADFRVEAIQREFDAIEFRATGSTTAEGHELTSYQWDFGDGATADGEIVSHAFGERGTYRIRLQVTDDRGLSDEVLRQVRVLLAPGDIAPWLSADVGEVTIEGAARFDGEDLLVSSGGAGLGGTTDAFHFLYREVTGDARLTLQLGEITRTTPSLGPAFAGLQFRETLSPAAPQMTVALRNPDTSPRVLVRSRVEDGGRNRQVLRDAVPSWLRLERSDDRFVASFSADGAVWEEVEQVEIPASETMFVGVAATANDSSNGGTLLNTRIHTLELAVSQSYLRGDCNADARTDLADGVFHLGALFGSGKTPRCLEACDTNRDGTATVSDAIFLFNYLLQGGPVPAPPFPSCGREPRPSLPCEEATCEPTT